MLEDAFMQLAAYFLDDKYIWLMRIVTLPDFAQFVSNSHSTEDRTFSKLNGVSYVFK